MVWPPLVIAIAVLITAETTAAETVVMRIAFPESERSWPAQGLQIFEQYVERSLPGQIDVRLYPGGSLVRQTRLVSAIRRGGIEGGFFGLSSISDKIPEGSIFYTAYLIRDLEHACTIIKSEFGRRLNDKIEALGIKPLAQTYLGTRSIALRRARDVQTPDDLAGLKLREPAMKAYQIMGRVLGANPTPIPYGELYLAMQTGTVDAYELAPSYITLNHLDEVTEQIVLTRHLVNMNVLFVSTRFWDQLNSEQQVVLEEGARLFSMFTTNNRIRAEARALEELKTMGIKITVPNVSAFQAHAKDQYINSDLAKDWPAGLYDRISAQPTDPACSIF